MSLSLLYWKEWREQRLIVLAAPLLIAALLVGYSAIVRSRVLGSGVTSTDSGIASGLLALTWLLSAALCSTSVMSPETGSGTLRFLSMLPVSRARLWRGKVTAALAAAAASIAASTLAYLLFCVAAGLHAAIDALKGELFSNSSILVAAVLIFAVGCYISMLMDNAVAALLTTIVIAYAAAFLTTGLGFGLRHVLPFLPQYGDAEQMVDFGLLALLFLWLSYRTFQLGETLKTPKRFRLLVMWPRWIAYLLINICLIAGALVGAFFWIVD